MSEFSKFSIVVPAHNEEKYIEKCLVAIQQAAQNISIPYEIIVVLNRCTDRTQEIAEQYGAMCIADESRCIATVRNKGVAVASGDVIVTCDADSRLHPLALKHALTALAQPNVVGGGMPIRFERYSMGIHVTEKFVDLMVFLSGLPCGAFWTTKAAFDAVGGFNEKLVIAEDLEFAQRLKLWGRRQGKQYRMLKNSPLVTSTRKFDHFGDWCCFKMMVFDILRIRRSLKGIDTEFVDEFFYEFNDNKK